MKKYLSLVLVLALVLTSWTFVASADEIKDLRDYQTKANEISTFCYQYSQGAPDLNVLTNVYDHLLTNDPNGALQPALATEWYSEDGNVTWTFVMRDDATWVDYQGNYKADVVPEDFATGLEWVLNNAKNEGANITMPSQMIKGAEEYYNYTRDLGEAAKDLKLDKFYEMVGFSIDGNKINITCKGPTPWFPTLCCYNCLAPLSSKLIDEIGVDGYFGATYDTLWYNGPYVISDFVNGSEKTLTKNESYYNLANVKLFDTVHIQMIDDLEVGFTAFQNGDLDVIQLTESEVSSIANNSSNEWHDYITSTKRDKYSFNWKWNYHKVFEDGTEDVNWNTAVANEAFRKAWYYGLDLTNYLARTNSLEPLPLQNYAYTMANLVSKSDGTEYTKLVLDRLGIDMSDLSTYIRYDADKAAAYKAQAMEELSAKGVTFPVVATWYIRGGDQTAKDTADVIAQTISDYLGDDFVKLETKTYVTNLRTEITVPGYHSFVNSGWGADYADPVNFLAQEVVDSDNAYFVDNYTHANDAQEEVKAVLREFTELVNKADAITGDIDARYEAMADAEAFYIEHALCVPTYYRSFLQLTSINDYSKIYSLYGTQSQRYVNWETDDAVYTTAQYEEFMK